MLPTKVFFFSDLCVCARCGNAHGSGASRSGKTQNMVQQRQPADFRALAYFGYGAVVTKELGGPLHETCRICRHSQRNPAAGLLGRGKYAPLNNGQHAQAGACLTAFAGISLGNGLTIEEIETAQARW